MLQLIHSGERERLKQLLRDKLTECGWRDEVKQRCRGERSLPPAPPATAGLEPEGHVLVVMSAQACLAFEHTSSTKTPLLYPQFMTATVY